ncbi:MAG: leucine-rich repeat domain-containing protein [Candidatus Thorarchaeota archaeon]
MLFCPKCGTRNKTTYNFCQRCGTKVKYSIEDIKLTKKEPTEYKINDFITLKLENGKTVIYVKDKIFLQCKYLLIEIPKERVEDFDEFLSIDDISENLDHSFEREMNFNQLKPEIEFWGHCSNLQAWAEHLYDTNLLHSSLSFPLLKKLTDVGDHIAKRVFKDEIVEKLANLYTNVAQYLIQENYLEYFNREEIEVLMEILFGQIREKFKVKHGPNLDDIEIEALLSIIKKNLINSKTFLINHLKPVDIIDKETHMSFTYEKGNVISLGLNRCGLLTLPFSIGNFKNLEELYLTENRLNNLPESIGNLTTLKLLNLSNNHLFKLPNEIGNLSNLKELHLNHNFLQFLPDTISKLKKLDVLSIWGNQLKKLPSNMNQMESLKVLGLSFNQLENFPDLINGFSSLEILDLSNNKIKTIPSNICNLESIKALWLNNNPITTIPESFMDIDSLTDLYLVNTPITTKKEIKINNILNLLETKDINIWR